LTELGNHTDALAVLQEADAVFQRAAVALPDRNLAERAELLIGIGVSHDRLGDYAQAVQHIKAGLALARQVNAPRVEIQALCMLGQAVNEQGDYAAAKQRLDEALTLARERGDRTREASALSMLASIAWRWGDIEQAGQWAREGLAIYRELGHQQRIPRLLNLLGIVAIMQEDYGQAEAYWEEGLGLIQEMGDRLAMADVLNNLGYINHHNLGDLEKAKQYYIKSLSIGREIGHRQGATSTLSNLGHLHILLGEHALAWEYLREALSESIAIGLTPLTLDALAGVALLQSETGQADSATEMVGLIVNHPSVGADSVQVAETILAELRDALAMEQLEAALARGKGMELSAVVAELLAEK
jgi:tetratricopeptide (TPR) repeat protein